MRILVVEDEPKLADLLSRGLGEAGHAVDVSMEGRNGLDLALAVDYDCIILDVVLPQMDGHAVCRELRGQGRKTPILFLTARTTLEDKIKGLDLGADDYLTKPFALDELLARLRALLRRGTGGHPQATLRVADLELDPAQHVVRRAGQPVELTAKEFALLEYLMRNTGLVLTRDMIADHIWNLNYEGNSNVVEVYINYLRRKIDHAHQQKLIHTVRGSGYTLKAE